MSPRSLVRTQAEGEKEGSITNAEFSAAVFYVMRKESLVDRDPKKVQSIKKFLEDTRKYAKLKESVDSGSMQMSDRWKKAEVFVGLAETDEEQQKQCEQEQSEQEMRLLATCTGAIPKVRSSTLTNMKRIQDKAEVHSKEVKKAKLSEGVLIVSQEESKMYEEDEEQELKKEQMEHKEEKLRMDQKTKDKEHKNEGKMKEDKINVDDKIDKEDKINKEDKEEDKINEEERIDEQKDRGLVHPLLKLVSKLRKAMTIAAACLECSKEVRSYCQGCLVAVYCGAACQVQHWQEHREQCSTWAARIHSGAGLFPPTLEEARALNTARQAKIRAREKTHATVLLYHDTLEKNAEFEEEVTAKMEKYEEEAVEKEEKIVQMEGEM